MNAAATAKLCFDQLVLDELEPGKPAIFAAGRAVFRCRSDDEGMAYARHVVECANAAGRNDELPCKSSAADAVGASRVSVSPSMSDGLARKVSAVLALHPSFAQINSVLLTKLLAGALESLLAPQSAAQPRPVMSAPGCDLRKVRCDAVAEFCNVLLASGDDAMPDEERLLPYVQQWLGAQ